MNDFNTALQNWLVRAGGIATDYTLTIDTGGIKYIRIVSQHTLHRSGRSVFCFVDKSNGDILKADSWRKPAKHARGNIFEIGKEGVDMWGALYLK